MPQSLDIALQNHTSSSTVFAYITGRAIANNNALWLLQSDGKTHYYPTSPPSIGTALSEDCGIPLGGPGNTVTVTIPLIAGGRIWFSVDQPLKFLLNPGPALVEPSVTNPTDPNIDINWGFCEFTVNNDQLYANISYVDFVSLPISLTLVTTSGATQHVTGMAPDGLDKVCSGLEAQSATDNNPGWASLVVKTKDRAHNLRALSPNNGIVMNRSLFANYFEPFVAQAWDKYRSEALSVDTQAAFGRVSGNVANDSGHLTFTTTDAHEPFPPPSTADIFSCSTGPFATGPSAARNTIIPRLAAAFNRSELLAQSDLPAHPDVYYAHAVTNHYSRVVHAVNLDGRGYAFPYDDVGPSGGHDQSGCVFDPNPKLFTVAVGGRQL